MSNPPEELVNRMAKAIAMRLFGSRWPIENELNAMVDAAARDVITAASEWLTEGLTHPHAQEFPARALRQIDKPGERA